MCIVTLSGYLVTCLKCFALLRGADSVLAEPVYHIVNGLDLL